MTLTVEVDGGTLSVHELPAPHSSGRTVVALHGITANGLSFAPLAARLGEGFRMLAPDLRGRADSNGIVGPWGLAAHVDDLITLLDVENLDKVTLVGHSMGAFVAALAAARHPDRFDRVVLVDGGFGFTLQVSASTPIDAVLAAVLGPAMDRMSVTFPSRQSYQDFWAKHPAVGPMLDEPSVAPYVLAYLQHDLRQLADGSFGTSCILAAIRADGAEVLAGEESLAALPKAAANPDGPPLTLLWAQRGMQNESPGMYDAEKLAAIAESVDLQQVSDTNHYSILLTERGIEAIRAAIAD